MTLFPVLPLRDIVVFPHMIVPLFVGRDKSVAALEAAMNADKEIFLVAQLDPAQDDPAREDLYEVGVTATVLQLLKLPDGTVRVLVEGKARGRLVELSEADGYLQSTIEILEERVAEGIEVEALMRSAVEQFETYAKLNKKLPAETAQQLGELVEAAKLSDALMANVQVKVADKQALLVELDPVKRLEMAYALMEGELGVLHVEKKIKSRVKRQMEKTQREYYLNEQLKAIQRELGNSDDEGDGDEIAELTQKIATLKLSKEARAKATGELKKLKTMAPMSAEATVVRNYLDVLLGLPWGKKSKIKKDIAAAQAVLDEDHYALEKVKDRIVEYLGVQARTNKLKGPILCLVGPPGVGKTSLGKSIAKATGRNFVRMSLGGVRDEAEIRGHRRTYIGSLPGKVIQSMKKAKSSNPLFLLDEIDKLGADFRGDPSSALLEVLDPEQNASFNDHYLEVDYDLSNVMFITTANSLRMAQPLMDRMEIIRLAGYTEDEKVAITRKHLIPKQIEANGLKPGEVDITDDAVRDLVRYYTREAGVRNLEREIANLARKGVKEILMKGASKVKITAKNLDKYAGVRRFRFGEAELEDLVGITTGLAWTEVGGELLQIEAVLVPGRGRVSVTGKLGDVMQESVQAANAYVRSRANSFGIKPVMFEKRDIHVHVPEGATPKDGPSAGVGMVTSIVSALTGIAVRKDVAMTGEISLRGRVLPIGGLKEKLLAALRGGLKTVLIPKENERDLPEIPDNVKKGLEIVAVSTVDEVLSRALVKPLVPVEWPNDLDQVAKKPEGEAIVAH